ncbi:MAG: Flp pilus assembly protein CpaB [Chloroflexota bacterium]
MGKKRGGIILTVLGLVLAIAVGVGVFTVSQQATAAEQEQMFSAVVVLAPIQERTVIPATSIGIVEVPKSVLPPTAVLRVDEAVGKMSMSSMYPGDWVLSNRLADTKGASGKSFTIEPGQVIVSFPASDVVAMGAVRTGDYVDVLITVDTSKERDVVAGPGQPANAQPVSPGGSTQLTMQNLRVLNEVGGGSAAAATTGGAAPPPSPEAKQVLFAVPRQEALILKQIKDYPGVKIELALRAAGDDRQYSTESVNMKGLIDRFKITAP